jgi:coenzyme F420-dependent glucose-6-phosphate dehydrogenase
MATIAYQASHEQFGPAELLGLVKQAEQAGFGAVNSSDHFHPWNAAQGQSGFAFAWLGAAMQATKLPFSSVCAPGQRYHPATVAQAIATLGDLFPGRFHINLASGEAINETITGDQWPSKEARNARFKECAEVIRRLLAGEHVSHHGHITVAHTQLYSLPEFIPPLFGAALTKETAYWLGGWADGLVTVGQHPEKLKPIVEAFRNGGGTDKPVHVKMDVSYATDEQVALQGAHEQWRTNIFSSSIMADTAEIAQFEELAKNVKPDDMREKVLVSSDLDMYVTRIHEIATLGVQSIILHNVNRQQGLFIETFGKHVLPAVTSSMRVTADGS